MNTKELDEKFTRFGNVFTQTKKGVYAYIYTRSDQFGIVCYEAFKRTVRTIPEGSFQWKSPKFENYDQYVVYPGNSNFGKWAKCCHTLERAEYWFDIWEAEGDGEG